MKLTSGLTRACALSWLRAMGPDTPLAHREIPYVFPPEWEGVRLAIGQATAQRSRRSDIGHIVTYLLLQAGAKFCWKLSIYLAHFHALLLQRAWLASSLNWGCEVTGVPAVSEVAMLNVTKHVYCTRSSRIIQSWAGLGLAASWLTHTLCAQGACLLYNGKGRTEAVVERMRKGLNKRKIISIGCIITISKLVLCSRDWKT